MFYQKKNNKLEPLTGSTLYAESPIGTVIASFLAVAPSGYIKADGTVYTKAQYPELYERIPDVFKDTTNETFTIDLREVALKGIGLSSLTSSHYSSTGLTLGEFIEDRLQQHKHDIESLTSSTKLNYKVINEGTPGNNSGAMQARGTSTRNLGATDIYSGRNGATTEVKSVGVNYFVKAKHVALPIDIMDAISEEYATKEYVDGTIRVVENNYTGSTGSVVRLANIPLPANSLIRITFMNGSIFSSSSFELRLDSNLSVDVKGLGNVFTWVTTSADILQVIGNPSTTGTWRYVIETRTLGE